MLISHLHDPTILLARCQQGFPIRAEGHSQHVCALTNQRLPEQLVGSDIPEDNHSTLTAGGQGSYRRG